MMTVSIVTVTLNSAATIGDTIRSVKSQRGVQVEHIIKDGCSSDDTIRIVSHLNKGIKLISSVDNGVYDAMNQGFECSEGDIVGFLNSDDFFASDDILKEVVDVFEKNQCDMVYGDISMIRYDGTQVRYWKCRELRRGSLGGEQIPHPALFVRRACLQSLGVPFDPTYRIAADLKQQLTLVEKMQVKAVYLPRTISFMRVGGKSTRDISSVIKGWIESERAYRQVHGRSGIPFVASKVAKKFNQFTPFLLRIGIIGVGKNSGGH